MPDKILKGCLIYILRKKEEKPKHEYATQNNIFLY